MSVNFGEGELGVISGGSRRYQLTWDDLLWAGRMLVGETGSNAGSVEGAAVLWTMASLLVKSRSNSFTRLIQAYSQPINPKWRRDGEFCRVGGRNNGRPECADNLLDRRDRTATIEWSQLPDDVQDLVFKWATGQINNPVPKATDFAVPRVGSFHRASGQRGAEGLHARGLTLIWDTLGRDENSIEGNGNAFYSTRVSNEWTPRYVRITGGREQEASDSNVQEVANRTRPFGENRRENQNNQTTLRPPENQLFERIEAITSNRESPPEFKYNYFTLANDNGENDDIQAQNALSAEQEDQMIRVKADRFYEQVAALKQRNNVEFTQMVPTILILTERDEQDTGSKIINLNEEIFSQSPLHGYNEGFDVFPDRPLASLVSLSINIQEPNVGGSTEIISAVLNIKVHNPQMVRRDHPKGKYIAYMMSQGYVLRIRYGIEGAYDLGLEQRAAFQWKEQDVFVSQFSVKINNDMTTELTVNLQPATQRLLNQIQIGQSLPVSSVGQITQEDVDTATEAASSGDSDATPEQIQELRNRLSSLAQQYNNQLRSPGAGLEEVENGSFGFVLHAALTNSRIFQREEGISATQLRNMAEALQTIQSSLLTRRFRTILTNDCYRYTHNNVSVNAVNFGPLMFNVVKPEIDTAFGIVSRNQIEIGEKFSYDDREVRSQDGNTRTNVKLVFGNFNSRAGQWANKPISMMPINVEPIFAHLRARRSVGEFSSTVNSFITEINRIINQMENFTPDRSQGQDELPYRIEQPQIKYHIYPDPLDDSSWIMYVFDNKVQTVRFREAIDGLSQRDDNGEPQLLTKEETINILKQHKIPWVEMGSEGNFIKSFDGETISDDMLLGHAIMAGNNLSQTTRDQDASLDIPVGISRNFLNSPQGVSQRQIRAHNYVAPIRLSLTSFIVPTAYLQMPIYVFFPVRVFSGIYLVNQLSHDVQPGSATTQMSLVINLSIQNQIPL